MTPRRKRAALPVSSAQGQLIPPHALKGREGLVLLEANALVTWGVAGKEEAGSAHHHADAANDVEDAAGPVQAQASVKAAGQKGKEEGEDG